jgi:hypothetical protein
MGRRCVLFDCNPDVVDIVKGRFQVGAATATES